MRRSRSLLPAACRLLLLLSLPWTALARADHHDPALADRVAAHYQAQLKDLFIWFHQNPELSFLEHRTAERLADELKNLGIPVTGGVGGTGLVGVIENGPGPRVLIRADMDGLPVKEASGLPYASTRTQVNRVEATLPVMHACGHDVHMTSLVGTAKELMETRNQWSGTVLLIGQPAEERIGGAKAMLQDGLYERFGVPDYAIAFHVSADGPSGKVAVRPGLVQSSSDSVDIIVKGVGAHGASPHRGKDPIYMASQLVIALQGIMSREVAPLQPGVITVGSIHGGFKHNIIPDQVKLQLTVRSNDEAVRAQLIDSIERVARGVGVLNGLPENLMPEVIHGFEGTPTNVNSKSATAKVRDAWANYFAEDRFYERPRTGMGAEDFAEFVQTKERVPGVYFAVGGTPEAVLEAAERGEAVVPSHHSPFFKIEPEPSVRAGVEATVIAARALLDSR
ncbi:MAG: amidohydrolase [Pseudomonadota bacterium]